MIDYHAIQLTGSGCAGANCAAASGGMAVYFGSGGKVRLTADQFRSQSHASCTPGVHSPSGGLYISDVIRVAYNNHVTLDYGQPSLWVAQYKRWAASEMKTRLSGPWGAIVLGDYDQIKSPYRAPTSDFMGEHSGFAHKYRASDDTVCWHDPLRSAPIRLPLSVLLRYWQKPGPVQGCAGFVRIPAVAAPVITSAHHVIIKRNAKIRLYHLRGSKIDQRIPYVDEVWDNPDSSAPCTAPVHRVTVDGRSSATEAFVLAGHYRGWHMRIGSIYGVTTK